MPLNPGNQAVTFNPPGNFEVDRLHTQPASTGLSSFTQPGCNLQDISVKDKVDNTAYAEATDKVFTPYNTNIAGVDAEWHMTYNGDDYRVLGVHNTPDALGRIYQGLFILKRETG